MTEAVKALEAIEDDLDESPSVQIRIDVAEYLATLSNEADTPNDFEQYAAPFLPTEVDFESESWISSVLAVQGWLSFGQPLDSDDVSTFELALSEALGFDAGENAFDSSVSYLTLTVTALDRLRDRAERAVQLQQIFVDTFQGEGGTRDAATRAWAEGWEEVEEADATTSPAPVSAKASTWRISDFVAQAKGAKLNLTPSYQRGDVWGTGARQLLIESVLRGIPLPSIILLKPSDGHSNLFEVVDGKQRLTSILRFVGQHPLALAKVKQADKENPGHSLLALFNDDYPTFKRAWKSLFNEPLTSSIEEQFYFPFKLKADDRKLAGNALEPLRGKYYTEIKNLPVQVADSTVSIEEVFEGYSDYNVPVIIYGRADHRQIHEVFNLYNKQGTHLNAEEIRNAIFHELQITRATLVAAGDSDPRTPVEDIAPALSEDWAEIEPLQATLRAYGFGESRYRRTKVLSWILSTLLLDSQVDRLPSTAKHIDALLSRVQSNERDRLRDDKTIRLVFEWVAKAAEAHAAYAEAWAPEFKDGENGAKWQELQLIGSLVGVAIAAAQYGDQLEERLADNASSMYEASKAWTRPPKTQTRSQWEYISRIAKGVTHELGVDVAIAEDLMTAQFGSSGLRSLWAESADVVS